MNVNTMNQDAALGVSMTVTQSDLPVLRDAGRLGEYAVVYRTYRQSMGGGFGDQEKHPLAWGVLVYVDGQVARIYSARGLPREWTDLARLERWIREQGFWYWWMRNDLEPLMLPASADDEDDVPSAGREEDPPTPERNTAGPMPGRDPALVPLPPGPVSQSS